MVPIQTTSAAQCLWLILSSSPIKCYSTSFFDLSVLLSQSNLGNSPAVESAPKYACSLQSQTPQPQDFEARHQVILRINHTIQPGLLQYRGLRVDHYGSFTSGLFTPSGDLDIAIEGTLRLNPSSRKGCVCYFGGQSWLLCPQSGTARNCNCQAGQGLLYLS